MKVGFMVQSGNERAVFPIEKCSTTTSQKMSPREEHADVFISEY